MKFVGIISGGKDSIYSICLLLESGHELVALVNVQCTDTYTDSFMYQTVGSEIVESIAVCLGVPLFIERSGCLAKNQSLQYEETADDEVEDLYRVLARVRESIPYDGVCSGAILSQYQYNRIHEVSGRLNVESLVPLWRREQKKLLREMIDYGMEARVVKVASGDFGREHLGRDLREMYACISEREARGNTGLNYCGEGGEYETVTFDCKFYKKRIVPVGCSVCGHPDNKKDGIGAVYYLKYAGFALEDKALLNRS